MIGAKTADDLLFDLPIVESRANTADSSALKEPARDASIDGRRLARAILVQAFEDAKLNPYGRGENERFNQDKERIIECIGEAQWFLLDDNDEDYPCAYPWCCTLLRLDPSSLRRKTAQLLSETQVLLSVTERHRLAERAGKRRLRQYFRNPKDRRQTCQTEGCCRLTKTTYCKWCLGVEGDSGRECPTQCVKCHQDLRVTARYLRRPYCQVCQRLCVREGCQELRRPGSRTSTCRNHHRIERRLGKLGDKRGAIYNPPHPTAIQ